MCKTMTVAYADYIGRRLVSWCVFTGKNEFCFLSDKQIKTKLEVGDRVNGLKLDENGDVTIDESFTPFLMGKSGLAFSPISADSEAETDFVMNKYYALVKVEKSKSGNLYHFITNRCGYEVFGESQLKAMLELMTVGGVTADEKGRPVVHPSVDTEAVQTDTETKNKSEGAV